MKSNVRRIAVSGALGAVSVVMALTPLGYIPWFGGAALTIMHIPVIAAAILEGPVAGTLVGLIFGVTSMIKAAVAPVGPLDPLFANPLVSVLPRLFIALAAWGIYALFRGKLQAAAAACAGAIGSFVNTVLVLSALALTASKQLSGAFKVDSAGGLVQVLAGLAVTNGLIEAAAAAVFTSALISAWRGIEKAHGRSRLADDDK